MANFRLPLTNNTSRDLSFPFRISSFCLCCTHNAGLVAWPGPRNFSASRTRSGKDTTGFSSVLIFVPPDAFLLLVRGRAPGTKLGRRGEMKDERKLSESTGVGKGKKILGAGYFFPPYFLAHIHKAWQIGRASCRERV